MAVSAKKQQKECEKIVKRFSPEKRYKKISMIGEGGIARVSRFFDTFLNRVIAVKELKKTHCTNPHLLRSFVTEAKLISFLDHPGITPMYDTFFLGKDRPCYSMKLLEGIRLSTLISYRAGHKGGLGIPLNRFCDVFRKLCDILSYVHDKGVIHLDVKPENIIAGTYGEVWLMDWGNARLFDPKPYYDYLSVHLNSITWTDIEHEAANIILGTPHYMSPEQTNMPRESLTPASDIFSAGIILYQMLTGIHPFTHVEETREVLVEIRNYTPPPPHEINSDVPVRLSVICERMLEKAPDKRYQDMKEVLEDFDEFYNSGMAFAIRNYQKGELVCREGEVGDYSFKILSGRVEVFKTVDGKKKPLAVLGANEIVGELAVFSKQPRSATVVALEPTTIRIMDKASVEKELEKLSPWVGNMITSLSKRFIEMNDKIVGLE